MKQLGFTLVELVLVIVLLGIVSLGVTSFIGLGTQIYIDVSSRDELMASGRFAIERLNRELRQALPNSVRVNANSTTQCLEFVPIIASGSYQDIPVAPEPSSNQLTMIADGQNFAASGNVYAAAYVLSAPEIYGTSANKRFLTSAVNAPVGLGLWTINFAAAITFATDSPTERLYLVAEPVSYCVSNSQLRRYSNYGFSAGQLLPPAANSVLMAEFLNTQAGVSNFFSVSAATQQRNSLVTIGLALLRNNESIFMGNEVQIVNVP